MAPKKSSKGGSFKPLAIGVGAIGVALAAAVYFKGVAPSMRSASPDEQQSPVFGGGSGSSSGSSTGSPGGSANGGASGSGTAGSAGGAGTKDPLNPPGLQAVRDELEADPHGTPAVLLQYAEKLANRMEEAEGSLEKAKAFFDELESCVTADADRSPRSVQALCLSNAEELSELHPELADRYQSLAKRAPPEVQKLLDAAAAMD